MASTAVIIDSGPLVAAFRSRDKDHEWARSHLEKATEPFVTCEAVLSESFYLLEKTPGGKAALCEFLELGIVRIAENSPGDIAAVVELIRRYDNLPMSFADACLVRMSECNPGGVILTIDSDFRIYRRNGRQTIPVIMPF
jgi:predicted nucleic acid-binding protein